MEKTSFQINLDKNEPERTLSKGLSLKLSPDSETLVVTLVWLV